MYQIVIFRTGPKNEMKTSDKIQRKMDSQMTYNILFMMIIMVRTSVQYFIVFTLFPLSIIV